MYKFSPMAAALAGVAAHASAQTGAGSSDETAASFAGFKVGVDIGYQHDEQRFRISPTMSAGTAAGFDFRGDGVHLWWTCRLRRRARDAMSICRAMRARPQPVSGATGDLTVRDMTVSTAKSPPGFSRGSPDRGQRAVRRGSSRHAGCQPMRRVTATPTSAYDPVSGGAGATMRRVRGHRVRRRPSSMRSRGASRPGSSTRAPSTTASARASSTA